MSLPHTAKQQKVSQPHMHGVLARQGEVGQPLVVVLVRHGQTPMTVAGEYSGSSEPGPSLNATGRVEAAQAADIVAQIGRTLWIELPRPTVLIASPMVRTQETAQAISRRTGLEIRTDPAFAEVHFGSWQGRTAHDVGLTEHEEMIAWHTTGTQRAPGGESVADVSARVDEALHNLAATTEGGRTVVVAAHTIVIRAAVGLALQAPVRTWNQLRVVPGSVTILRRWPDGMTEIAVLGYARF